MNTTELLFAGLRSWAGFPVVARILTRFPTVKMYLAGGAVRNVFLDGSVKSKDFDLFLAGDGTEDAISAWAESGKMNAGPFGSPRWYPDVEDCRYCDLIRVDRFRTGLWPCKDIIDVLNQFDFTGNALAVDLRTGQLLDPLNGLRDLSRRVLRAVRLDFPDGPFVPGKRLSRLAVLWFRLVHYAAVLGLEIEPVMRQWLNDHAAYQEHRAEFAATFFEPSIEGWHCGCAWAQVGKTNGRHVLQSA